MPAPRLISALTAFARSLEDARDIAEDARNWATPTAAATVAQISAQRRDILTETAFLRAFIAWEIFLEETFLLYLLGHRLPKRTAPVDTAFHRHGKQRMNGALTARHIRSGQSARFVSEQTDGSRTANHSLPPYRANKHASTNSRRYAMQSPTFLRMREPDSKILFARNLVICPQARQSAAF
jgi:hypothetical protein